MGGDFSFLNILAGVVLILFGARFLRKGFDRLLGQNLVVWLERMTAHRLRAFAAGVCISTIAPSSTTLALVIVRMLDVGRMTADRMLAVFLGANIGMTVLVQMIAFKIESFFSVFLIVGLFGFQVLKRDLFRGIGQCLLALGFIFLGIFLISGTASQIPPDGAFGQILTILKDYPVVLIVGVAIIAFLLQSSTAAIGLGLALEHGGVGGLGFLIAVVLGTNLGVAVTAMVAGWPTLEGRRLGSANLILKLGVSAAIFIFLGPILQIWGDTPGHAARQAANFHTGFNVIVAMIGLPLVRPLYYFVERYLIPTPQEDSIQLQKRRENFLDSAALESPSMALANATRQTMLMADEVRAMLENFLVCFSTRNVALARQLQKKDDEIDVMNNEIKSYLSRLSEESMGTRDSRLQLALFSFTSELEAIGDIIDRNLCHQVIKKAEQDGQLSDDDTERLRSFYNLIAERFEMAINILATRDKQLALKMVRGKDEPKEEFLRLQTEHYAALRLRAPGSLDGSSYFIDMLNGLRRISSHLTSIGHHFVDANDPAMAEFLADETEFGNERSPDESKERMEGEVLEQKDVRKLKKL
ncbi:MAG TPA: Na/Pi cotransporter family protein [Opitutales bacterium]|nr:Na/Pi cotransporter family protein [Opitutales bacterium]